MIKLQCQRTNHLSDKIKDPGVRGTGQEASRIPGPTAGKFKGLCLSCSLTGECKTHTIPILMHQMRISTTYVIISAQVKKVGNPKNC
jgi:hypothetical protein